MQITQEMNYLILQENSYESLLKVMKCSNQFKNNKIAEIFIDDVILKMNKLSPNEYEKLQHEQSTFYFYEQKE